MNVLSRRILHYKSIVLHGIACAFTQSLFLRSFSSTTRQELGRQFEEIVAQSLRKFSFDVAVCGGPKDRGIDFRGFWLLKSSSVRVIGQCKRYKKRLGPRHIRELEGTLTHEVNGTLGIIVTECGYSKDAYAVFMGSLYPIALTTLKGFSDDLLRWYSDEGNNETFVDKSCNSAENESFHQVQYKPCDIHLPGGTEIVNELDRNFTVTCTKKRAVNNHPASIGKNVNYNHFNRHNITCDNRIKMDISSTSDVCESSRANAMGDRLMDATDDNEQLTSSNISEIGSGIFTMFELNPTARKLLPNLVVGMKYRRHNSKTPELFINEDDSFVSVTK